MTSKKKVALITFGCAKNLVDSEIMAGYLQEAGYSSVADPAKADVIILNTCGFIRPSQDEAEAAIKNAISLKKNAPKKIIVAGCYSERYRPSLQKKYPDVDNWIGIKEFDKVVRVIEGKPFSIPDRTFLYDHTMPRVLSTPASWAYVKISEGCSHECAFCSIPLIKGDYHSRPISSILEEVETLASRGIKEINLVSQDTTYFGKEKGRQDSLPLLLKELLRIRDIAWVRILYGYPEEITEPLLEIMQEPKICPYLDIPFQHENPDLIRSMKRSMDGRRAFKLLDKIRKKIPDIAIRTSLIVGFPGEGRKEFEHLMAFVKEAGFDHLGVFIYSREKGTAAYPLGDPIKESIKQKRKNKIMEIQAGISAERLKSYVGRNIDVLIEGAWKDDPRFLIGRSVFQAPEVDGVVFIEDSRRLERLDGPLQQVEITASEVYDLRGKLTE